MGINSRLRMAIAADGRYQYEIAGTAGLSEILLSQVIRGRRAATPEQQQAIARALGVAASEIFNTDDNRGGVTTRREIHDGTG